MHTQKQEKNMFRKMMSLLGPAFCTKEADAQTQKFSIDHNETADPLSRSEKLPGLGPILVSTLPKSGTMFIFNMLHKGLGLKELPVTGSRQMHFPLIDELMPVFADDQVIYAGHISADFRNLLNICLSLDRFILHVRDPRAALVSSAHYISYRAAQGFSADKVCTFPELWHPQWSNSGFTKKCDICIESIYKDYIQFLKEWFKALQIDFAQPRQDVYTLSTDKIAKPEAYEHCPKASTQVLLTTHEELVILGEEAFFEKILTFYGIEKRLYKKPALKKNMELNFREGRTDSWKKELTDEQQARVTVMLPEAWLTFFNWL